MNVNLDFNLILINLNRTERKVSSTDADKRMNQSNFEATSWIRHFRKYHNYLFVPPQFRITIVFSFSWDDSKSQEKLKTMVMSIFWGGRGDKKIIMVFSKVANKEPSA